MEDQKGLSPAQKGKVNNYRYQLFPSLELRHLVAEALKVTHDPLIRGMEKGWFSRLIRAALTCYIAYCKTVASEIEKNGE